MSFPQDRQFDGQETQIGDLVEISNHNTIDVFEIKDIQNQNDTIIYLVLGDKDDRENEEVILELSLNENKLFGLSNSEWINDNRVLVKFIGPDYDRDLESEFFDRIECFDLTELLIEKLTRFWLEDGNELDLSEMGCNMIIPRYFSHPRIINKLQILDLSENELKLIPPGITNLHNLRTLDLSNNEITSLPKNIGNLLNLKVLDLSINKLTSLPEEPWDCVAVLRTLDIRNANGIGNQQSS